MGEFLLKLSLLEFEPVDLISLERRIWSSKLDHFPYPEIYWGAGQDRVDFPRRNLSDSEL